MKNVHFSIKNKPHDCYLHSQTTEDRDKVATNSNLQNILVPFMVGANCECKM
jgi:hypothetical protein